MRYLPLALAITSLACTSTACTSADVGQIVIAVQTDVHLPKDIDTIRVEVTNEGVPKFDFDYERLGTDAASILLPGTLTLVGSEEPSDSIHVTVSAWAGGTQGGDLRIVREAVTTVPEGKTVTMQLPLQFLCDDSGVIIGLDDVDSDCPEGQTCLAGRCDDDTVDSAELPDYDPDEIFVPGVCIDVEVCFNDGVVVEVDGECSIDGVTDTNVALQTEGDGICGAIGCFVALDANSTLGWQTREDGRIQLPPAVCDQVGEGKIVNVVTAPTNEFCPFKTVSVPTCGPWSAAGPGSMPGGPVVVAGGQAQPVSLRLGGSAIYWTVAGTFADDGSVKAVDALGGTPSLLADGQAAPRDILVDGDRVLWTAAPPGGGAGSIVELNDTGEVSEILDMLDLPEGIAADSQNLFFTEFSPTGRILQANLESPGSALTLTQGFYPFRIVASGTHVYWTNEGTFGNNDGSVQRYDYGGSGGLETIVDMQPTPRGLTLDDSSGTATALYWTTFDENGSVMRVEINAAGLGAVEVVASGQSLPVGVAIDEGHIYWTNRGSGTVARLAKNDMGGTPEVLSEGQRSPSTIVLDDSSIFWVNEGTSAGFDGAVVRMAKPGL